MSTIQIDRLLDTVIKSGASDLHLSTGRKPTLRLHGALRNVDTKVLDADDTVALMKSITPERCQQELQEEGSCDFGFAYGDKARFRVAVFRQRGDVSLVLRLIPNELLTFDQIGLPEICRELIRRPRGLFVVTGPTGSGKTTSLATMIDYINQNLDRHIVTVEDPIEYHLDGITQTQTHDKIGMTFGSALRALLRQDPDVILVGEIRDIETAEIAVQASLTGHLVFSTLHTNDAPSSVTRLINMGIEPFLAAAAVNAVLAQRLVRRICNSCKQQVPVPEEIREFLVMHGVGGETMAKGKGCGKCRQTGYSGRQGLYELLVLDDHLRDATAGNPNVTEFRRMCKERGMVTLREDGFTKVRDGITTVEEILRVTEATI